MKKLQKMALVAFFGLLAVSFGSCTKDLENRLDKVEKDVAQLITDVTTLKSTLADLSKTVDGHTTAIKASQDKIAALEAKPSGVTAAELAAAKLDLENKIKAAQDAVAVKSVVEKDGVVTMTYLENGVSKTITYRTKDNSSKVTVDNTTNEDIITVTVDGTAYSFPKKVASGNSGITGLYFIPGDKETAHGLHGMHQYMILSLSDNEKLLHNEARLEPALFATHEVNFRVNPASADVSEAAFSVAARFAGNVDTRATGDDTNVYANPTAVAYGTGAYTFTFNVKNWNLSRKAMEDNKEINKARIIALETKVGENVITSDYVTVNPEFFCADVADKTVIAGVAQRFYPSSLADAKANEGHFAFNFDVTADKRYNVNELVEGLVSKFGALGSYKKFAEYGFKQGYSWRFTNVSYVGKDGVTDQSKFIDLDKTTGIISVLQGTAAISREPIIKAEIVTTAGVVVARGYIKFVITNIVEDVNVAIDGGNINYTSLFAKSTAPAVAGDEYARYKKTLTLGWEQMNNIYTNLGMSHDEFKAIYNIAPEFVAAKSSAATQLEAKAAKRITYNAEGPNVDTYAITYDVTAYAKFGATNVAFKFAPKVTAGNKFPNIVVTFSFNVIKPELDKQILADYKWKGDATGKTVVTKGMYEEMQTGITATGGTRVKEQYFMKLFLGEAFDHPKYKASFDENEAISNKIYGAKHGFRFVSTSTATNLASMKDITTGQSVRSDNNVAGTTSSTLDKTLGKDRHDKSQGITLELVSKLTTADRTYAMVLRTSYVNGVNDDFSYNVRFENPLAIAHADNAKFDLQDTVDPNVLNSENNYNVTFLGQSLSFEGTLQGNAGNPESLAYRLFHLGKDGAWTSHYLKTSEAYNYELIVEPTYEFLLYKSKDGSPKVKDGSASNPLICWYNNGTKLQNRVEGGKLSFTFSTPFASVTIANDPYFVNPIK